MIRYEITAAELNARIDKLAPSWRAAARRKTSAFQTAGEYKEKKGSWSEIKPVFMELQGGKCAYCERRAGTDEKSTIEHDVEHFRPKSAVKAWPPAGSKLSYGFETGPASQKGYFLLAYNPLNYIASCKKCNTPYKSNYFPIARSKRLLTETDFAKLAAEKPFLIYPISDIDDDPADLITFEGIVPSPRAPTGHAFRRARVTIDFFDLAAREELLRERAELVKTIYMAFRGLSSRDSTERSAATQTIRLIDSPRLPHRNCARAYYLLCKNDLDAARQHCNSAIKYLDSLGLG
jgi:hypothetical protein